MTKKDYIKFGALYSGKKPKHPEFLKLWREEVAALCGMFKRDNPRFDENRFKTACGW